ncbi:ABC transporter permease [Ramlibacter sp. USB13]|uniref:Transport permease protein n=2 Tax=Ramlibacter cellulosilyticus TaxID=2764187 RepID=A0A923SDM4_9BURK|nr:ABC transporter permease [Ramlibacter cellulosilyticus]
MVKREVVGRYRGSVMGLLWSLLTPLLMLVVYTFVFSVVLKARWSGGPAAGDGHGQFAILLFSGLIVHGLFAEVVNRAPTLVIGNANYVKRVVFPLEVLPVITAGAALFHAAVSFLVLLGGVLVATGSIPWTAIFFPLVVAPLLLLTLGVAWFLASLGVYMRDVGQVVGLLTTVLLFLSPVFFPISAVPEAFRPWMHVNPLTFVIEQARAVMVFGQRPDLQGWALYSVGACVFAWIGYAWFQKTRKGFADVL